MTIRIKISELLRKHKMNQKELAEKTGIRPATISALFHNQIKRIDVEHINSLCRAFNCSPCEIFEYTPDDKYLSSDNISEDNIDSNEPFHYITEKHKIGDSKHMKLVNTESGIIIREKYEDGMELINTGKGIIIKGKNEIKRDTYNLTRKYIEEILIDIINDNNNKNN